jgi:hypothetical protein
MFCLVELIITVPLTPRRDIGIRPRRLACTPLLMSVYIRLIFTIDGKTVAYFRGRKLYGKQLKVLKGYRGVVVSSTDRILPKSNPAVEEENQAEEPDVRIMEEHSEFDDIMLWGHESLPDDNTDPYVRGMEEWIAFAEQVCSPSFEEIQPDVSRSILLWTKRTNQW